MTISFMVPMLVSIRLSPRRRAPSLVRVFQSRLNINQERSEAEDPSFSKKRIKLDGKKMRGLLFLNQNIFYYLR